MDYKAVEHKITTADGGTLTTAGVGDLHIDLPNGSGKTKTILKGAVHAPDMAFTLISISQLDKAGFSVLFNKGMCTIKDTSNKTITTIPNSNGLYKITTNKQTTQSQSANVVSGKMMISEAHRKLGHVSYGAIKHAVSKGFINGITIDPDSKPDFCEACAKAKLARQPFPQESNTRAKNYGEQVYWDLWGPASVKSLSGNSYVAARIDDATRKSKLYFQQKKSQLFQSYKKDEAYIKTQSGNRIKVSRSD
jgi:GAG-pre-integrase domain